MGIQSQSHDAKTNNRKKLHRSILVKTPHIIQILQDFDLKTAIKKDRKGTCSHCVKTAATLYNILICGGKLLIFYRKSHITPSPPTLLEEKYSASRALPVTGRILVSRIQNFSRFMAHVHHFQK